MTLLEYINQEKRGYMLPFMGTNGLYITGYNLYDVYEDSQKQLEVAKKMDEIFPSDFIYAMDDGNIFAEVLGAEMLKPDKDFASVINHPVSSMEDIEKISIPEPEKIERMIENLKALKLVSKNFNKPLFISIQGPFTLAVQLAGAKRVLKGLIKDKEFVKSLLQFTTEVVLRYALEVEKAGVSFVSIAEPSTVMLNPERFEEYIVPSLRRIYSQLKCWKGIHICGDTRSILNKMLMCGVDAVSVDQILDLKEIINYIPKDVVLIGNLDPINLLYKMTPDEIEKEVLELKKTMEHYNNYLMGFGCSCLNETPVENLQTAIKVGRS